MGTRMITFACAAVLAGATVTTACSSDEKSAAEYAEEQAQKIRAEKKAGVVEKIESVDVAVKGGVRIECTDLFTDVEAFSAAFPNPVRMEQPSPVQQLKEQSSLNAICNFIREGEPPTAEEQKKMLENPKNMMRLGTIPGDKYCTIYVNCGQPYIEDFESKCRKMFQHEGSRDLGVFACMLVTQMAERDKYSYKFFEPDTKCHLEVLPGNAVADKTVPVACGKLAIEQMTAGSIEKYQQ